MLDDYTERIGAMDWKKQAVEDLKSHEFRRKGLDNIRRIVAANQHTRKGFQETGTNTPQNWSDRQLDLVCEEGRLQLMYAAADGLVRAVDDALSTLTADERKVLDAFYIHRSQGHVPSLMKELGYEQRQIYKIKDRALYHFTVAMYGFSDF